MPSKNVSIGARKLGARMAQVGGARVASETGLSQPALRALVAGRSAPRNGTRAALERAGIALAGEWGGADLPRAPTTPTLSAAVKLPDPPREGATPDELSAALAEARRIYFRGEVSPTDKMKAANVAATCLNVMIRAPRPSRFADYVAFDELRDQLRAVLRPYPISLTEVMAALDESDVGDVSDDPSAPAVELVSLADAIIASADVPTRDKATALALKARAAKLLAKIEDDPRQADDWPALRERLLAILRKSPDALKAAVDALAPPPGAIRDRPLAPRSYNVNFPQYAQMCREKGWTPRESNDPSFGR